MKHQRHIRAGLWACTAVALLAACANRPESIRASHVSFEKFMDQECTDLTLKMADARSYLAKFSEMQNSKGNVDAVRVILGLLGIPVRKPPGDYDYEAEVAMWKGEIEAIETAQIKKKCA